MEQSLVSFLVYVLIIIGEVSSKDVFRKPGEQFRTRCGLSYDPHESNSVLRIFKGESSIEQFNTKQTFEPLYISNNTAVDPNLPSGHFKVEQDMFAESLALIIDNVTIGDAGQWKCEKTRSLSTQAQDMDNLIVEGPIISLYWTTNSSLPSPLDPNPPSALADGATVSVKRGPFDLGLYCVIILTNTEPMINFTIGRYGEDESESVEKTDKRESSHLVYSNRFISSFSNAVRFTPRFTEVPTQLEKPLYCRASQSSMTLERSVVVNILSAPKKNAHCNPYTNYADNKEINVRIHCLIAIKPIPSVEWTIINNQSKVTETSPLDGYRVENEIVGGFLKSTLVIKQVRRYDFGYSYVLNLKNSEGEGRMTVVLLENRSNSSWTVSGNCNIIMFIAVAILHLFK